MKTKFQKVVLILMVIFFLTTSLFAVGQKEGEKTSGKKTIAFVGYSTTQPFWIGLRDAAKAQAEKMGVNFLDLTAAEPDAVMQKQAVENAIGQKVDGLIIGAVDNRAFDDSLDKAQRAGIPCIAVDTAIDHSWISFLVQTDNLAAAGIAGEYIAETMKPGKVLILGGTVGHQTGDARRDGVKKIVEAAGFEVIYRACDWLADVAYETALNELNANPDISAIFNACDPMALSAVSAVKEVGRDGEVLIIGFDGNPENLQAIKSGEQHADIKQDNVRMGQEGVINLLKIINGEGVKRFIPIDGILITKDNVNQFIQ